MGDCQQHKTESKKEVSKDNIQYNTVFKMKVKNIFCLDMKGMTEPKSIHKGNDKYKT